MMKMKEKENRKWERRKERGCQSVKKKKLLKSMRRDGLTLFVPHNMLRMRTVLPDTTEGNLPPRNQFR